MSTPGIQPTRATWRSRTRAFGPDVSDPSDAAPRRPDRPGHWPGLPRASPRDSAVQTGTRTRARCRRRRRTTSAQSANCGSTPYRVIIAQAMTRTFSACGPFWPWAISNSTRWPSSSVL